MPDAEGRPPGKAPGRPKILFGPGDAPGESPAPQAAEARPRVLFPADAPSRTPREPGPGEQRRPGVPFGTPQPPAPKGGAPKIIGDGSVRQRIPCSLDDLQSLDPTVSPGTTAQALRIVASTNLDDAHFDDVLRFGAELQAEHGAIAEQELAIASAPVLHQGQGLLARVIGFLGDLDPERVFGIRRGRLASTIRIFLEPARTPRDIFATTYPQLLAAARELQGLETALLALFADLSNLGRRYAALTERIASHILAANFIAQYARDAMTNDGQRGNYLSQADALTTRVSSLLGTQTTVEMGRLTNEALRGNVQALIDASRGMIEEDLPAFHTVYTAAFSAASGDPAASAESDWFQPVRDVHARLVRKVKGDQA